MTTFASRPFAVDNAHAGSASMNPGVDAQPPAVDRVSAPTPDPVYSIVPGSGRLRCENVSDLDRNTVVAMHLSPIAAFVLSPFILVIPILLWGIRKDQSPLADDHGREFMNFAISFTLLHVICAITLIGFLAMPVLWVVGVIAIIRATIAGSRGEFYRYPMTFRFIT